MSGSSEVLFVLGTRPEIIKMAPVIRAVEARDALSAHVVHTNQHYDAELSDSFFGTLGLPPADENLGVGSAPHGEQTAAGLEGVERVVEERDPAAVLAQGDTNAVLSAALAASKLPVPFGHVEAGIRSFDREMPEERNRVFADAAADLAFAPTAAAAANLEREGTAGEVFVTGNTVVDACREHAPIAERESDVIERFDLPERYAVATIHRPRNADDPDRLARILRALDARDAPVVFPVHPRTSGAIADLDFEPGGSLRLVDPLDYLDFLRLLDGARAVVTDSGGVQEEASILEVPCLTVRPNTERPETTGAGVNELVEPEEVADRLATLLADDAARAAMTGRPDLYGDGTAGERIADIVARRVDGKD